MGKKDNLVAGIMTILIIAIFLVTTYFCLDIFGIIEVPEKLSLAKILSNQTNEVVAIKPIDELIVTEENIDEWLNNNTEEQVENVIENEVEPLERNIIEEYIIEENPEENKTVSNVTNKMYYYQLDMYGKMIYDKMYDNLENLKTGTYVADFDTLFNDLLHEENGEVILENAFQFGINALLFDHPEIFFLDITKMYMSTEITSLGPLKTYRVKIGALDGASYLADAFYDKQSVEVVTEMLETVKNNVKGSIISNEDYNKIRAVHDYLINVITYERTVSKDNIYNIYGALINKEAVCEGYSKAFKYIMDDLGIPCIIVCGIGQNSNGETESHAWNYVKLDDNWYAIDCTWDDPLIIGSGYVSQNVYEKYFLKGSDQFFKDHVEDGKIVEGSNFVYPTLSIDNY